MKRASLILLATALCGFARGQELQVPDPQPADSVIQLNYSDGLHQVQRELTLLTDPATDWWLGPRDNALSGYVEQKSWLVGVDAATFLRDAAFSLPYTRGYTATGFFVSPYAKHRIGRNAQMTFGVHLAGAAGSNGIRLWKPLVRLEYKPHDNVRLVMGSLYGALTHRLFEPMLDRERYVYDHYEEGVQILAQLPLSCGMGLIIDTWLHWEELLEPWQMTQERFALGSSNELLLWEWAKDTRHGVMVWLPFSFLGTHRGGQFSALDTCIQSLFNENVGLRVNVSLDRESAVALDLPLFFYQDISPEKWQAYDKGWALWPQLSCDFPLPNRVPKESWHDAPHWHGSWQLMLQAGYWYGHQYIAPRGSYLFQSVSWHKANFAVPEREMITAKMSIENRYTSKFSLGFDAEFYYDTRVKALDFAFGIYMRYRLGGDAAF